MALGGFSWSWGPQEAENGLKVVDLKAVAAEFVAMVLFVTVGCGTVCGHGAFDAASRLQVAFSFGMTIMVLAYAIGKHSGGQINSAVTLSLMLGGILPWCAFEVDI
jgi:aquaporin Z